MASPSDARWIPLAGCLEVFCGSTPHCVSIRVHPQTTACHSSTHGIEAHERENPTTGSRRQVVTGASAPLSAGEDEGFVAFDDSMRGDLANPRVAGSRVYPPTLAPHEARGRCPRSARQVFSSANDCTWAAHYS